MKLLCKFWNFLIDISEEMNEYRRKYKITRMY